MISLRPAPLLLLLCALFACTCTFVTANEATANANANAPGAPPTQAAQSDELLVNKLARVFKAALTGTVSPEVLAQREKEDRDAGVIRLTDENYDSLVAEGDPSILWVVLVHEDTPGGHSRAFYDAHTNATRLFSENAVKARSDGLDANGKLVLFARLAYASQWKTCTRWLVFRPPRLVFITDQGKTVRFLSARNIAPLGDQWATWIADGGWTNVEPWVSRWKSGGDRAWLVEKYIRLFELTGPFTKNVPAIVWLFISGVIGKILTDLFFPPSDPETAILNRPQGQRAEPSPALVAAAKRRSARVSAADKKK